MSAVVDRFWSRMVSAEEGPPGGTAAWLYRMRRRRRLRHLRKVLALARYFGETDRLGHSDEEAAELIRSIDSYLERQG